MAEFPALPLFTDSYLADTLDLTVEQHGCYMLMLLIAWRRPDCALPGDMTLLRRSLAGATADMHGNRFNRLVPFILNRFFHRGKDGQFHQKRLGKERDFQRKVSEKNRENAEKRWGNGRGNKENQSPTDAAALRSQSDRMPFGNAPSPSPSPSGKERSIGKGVINSDKPVLKGKNGHKIELPDLRASRALRKKLPADQVRELWAQKIFRFMRAHYGPDAAAEPWRMWNSGDAEKREAARLVFNQAEKDFDARKAAGTLQPMDDV